MRRRNFLTTASAVAATTAFGIPKASLASASLTEIDLRQKGFVRRIIETPVGAMAVHEAGMGKPLLLLHGVGAGASSFLWYKIAPRLAESYRVIAPDFVGWGASDRPDRNLLFDDYVAQIRSLADAIAMPMYVIADSLTCGFVIDAIDKRLLNAEKLVLMSPSGALDFGIDASPPQSLAPFREALGSPDQEQFYARIFHQRPAVEDWFRNLGFSVPSAAPEELILANLYYARRPNASYSALPFLAGDLRYDIAPYLAKVPDATLMIWGEGEFQIPPSARAKIEQANSDIETARIANARSVFKVERPDETLDVVLPFLARTGS